jgi:hypothetical protein
MSLDFLTPAQVTIVTTLTSLLAQARSRTRFQASSTHVPQTCNNLLTTAKTSVERVLAAAG